MHRSDALCCLRVITVSVLLATVMALAARAQSPMVELRLQLKPGEMLAYEFAFSSRETVKGDVQDTIDSKSQGYEVVRVLDVGQDGLMLIEVTLEGVKDTIRDRPAAGSSFRPTVFRVRNDGRVMEIVRGPWSPEEYPMALPDRPLTVGELWTREEILHIGAVPFHLKGTFTLAGVEQASGGQAARITVQSESSIEGKTPGLFPGTVVNLRGTSYGDGEFQWLVDQGRLLRLHLDSAGEAHAELSMEGRTIRAVSTIKVVGRIELAAPESLKGDIAQDVTIRPGVGVGPFRLEHTVADLTARLGKPVVEPDVGFQSQRLRWPNGLVGHTETPDSVKLIGLEVADLRYQTGRGIGLESSEKTVLLTHGSSPSRTEIISIRLGTNQFLIYDDQGIAFAFRTDPWYNDFSRPSTPQGTVSFVVVFPPGTATRIFPTQ